jgi:hypothetical protein
VRPWAFVLDHEYLDRAHDRYVKPRIAGGQMTGQVERKGRLAGATVAVEHDVAVFGDQGAFAVAEQSLSTSFFDVDELVEGDDV